MSTVRIFRIVHRKYAGTPYSGKGGLYAAGRWSSRGRLVSYAADSLALATLELLARLGSLARLREMVYIPADLSEEAVTGTSRAQLPPGWDRHPPGSISQVLGNRWLGANRSVALRVPSVLLPEGHNYVLNPTHPDVGEALTSHEARPLDLDPRILERLRERKQKDR